MSDAYLNRSTVATQSQTVNWYLVPEEDGKGRWRMTTLRPAQGTYRIIRNGLVEPATG